MGEACASSSIGMCFEAGVVKFDFGENVFSDLVKAVAVISQHVHPIVDLSLVVTL